MIYALNLEFKYSVKLHRTNNYYEEIFYAIATLPFNEFCLHFVSAFLLNSVKLIFLESCGSITLSY